MGVEPALKNDLSGYLVDDGAALFGVASGFVEGALGGDSAQAFVPEDHAGGGNLRAERVGERLDFLGGRALGAIHILGESEHDGIHGALADDGGDALEGFGVRGDGFEGMGEHAEFV